MEGNTAFLKIVFGHKPTTRPTITTSFDNAAATSASQTLLDSIALLVSSQWPPWLTTQHLVVGVALLAALCSFLYGLLPVDSDAATGEGSGPHVSFGRRLTRTGRGGIEDLMWLSINGGFGTLAGERERLIRPDY